VRQRVRGAEARGAGADDGNIDFGDQWMLTETLIKQAYVNPAAT
jgi:hypothetical protein